MPPPPIATPTPRRASTPPAGLRRPDVATWLGLVAYLAFVHVYVAMNPVAFTNAAQAQSFTWTFILAIGTLGLGALWLAVRVGFPALWDPRVPHRWRFGWPALAGALGAVAAIGIDEGFGLSRVIAERLGVPSLHVGFPASAVLYPGAAIVVCAIYYLIPMPVVVAIVSRLILAGRFETGTAVIAAVLVSLLEPMQQAAVLAGRPGLLAVTFALVLVVNLAQALLFRRAGLLAPLTLRATFYLVWHVAWPLVAR
jgi:hypothetical protein